MNIGEFPVEWEDRTLIYFEPHYDDFILNAYSILLGMRKRKALSKPKNLVIVSVSHSDVNCNNGLRAILNKRDTQNIRLMELGFPDIIWDKNVKKDLTNATDEDIYNYYQDANHLISMLMRIIRTESVYNKCIAIVPLAEYYSHPMHRLVTQCVLSNLDVPVWYYRDNPYCYKDSDTGIYPGGYMYILSKNQLAERYMKFVENYEHQVQTQVVWYNSWMLEEDREVFYQGE